MQTNETLRKMYDMRLAGMADAFKAQLADHLVYDEICAEDRIGMLVDAESDRRQKTRLTNLIKGAKLRFPDACPESIIDDPARKLDRTALARYFSCKFIEDATDIVLTGPTGVGKSFLSCALAMAACRHLHTTRYTRQPELLDEFRAARQTGRYEKVLAKYRKYACLVIDDFMLHSTTKEETRDLYELIEGRSQKTSTIYCSQYQEAGWLERLGQGTSAEGIVDRITNNAYRIKFTGDVNMREMTSKVIR